MDPVAPQGEPPNVNDEEEDRLVHLVTGRRLRACANGPNGLTAAAKQQDKGGPTPEHCSKLAGDGERATLDCFVSLMCGPAGECRCFGASGDKAHGNPSGLTAPMYRAALKKPDIRLQS
jgi:hypothetical protein